MVTGKSSKKSSNPAPTNPPITGPSWTLKLLMTSPGEMDTLQKATEDAFVAELCPSGIAAGSPTSECGGGSDRSRLLSGNMVFVQFEIALNWNEDYGRRLGVERGVSRQLGKGKGNKSVTYLATGTFTGEDAEVLGETIAAANAGVESGSVEEAINKVVPGTTIQKLTESPSSAPSDSPSSSPAPSESPSVMPSKSPSPAPTDSPSSAPTSSKGSSKGKGKGKGKRKQRRL